MGDEKTRVAWLTGALESVRRGGQFDISGCHYEIALSAGALDDCAVLAIDGAVDVVIATDYVRGPKFLLYEMGHLTNADIGRFLVTANISDLAAMGAAPVGMLTVVRYPSEMSDSAFQEVMLGIDDGCRAYGARLLGGDTGSAERLILSGSAIGLVPRRRALPRTGAEPGDAIIVTGAVGGAGAAVLAAGAGLITSLDEATWGSLLDCWRLPVAQPTVGRALVATGLRIGCEDVSDGLRTTVRELGERNSLSAVLTVDSLPLHRGVPEVARLAQVDSIALGISASTDFVLCVTCAEGDVPRVLRAMEDSGHPGTVVGRLEPGEGVWLETRDGSRVVAPGVEWKHQPGDVAKMMLSGLKPSRGR